mgnify:CR=1 FL=1
MLRTIFILLGSLIAFVVLGIAALVVFVDPNNFRGAISDALETQTGRSVAIDGSLSWQFFPRLGIEVGAVSIGSGADFGDTPLISTQGLSFGMQVMPLLRGDLALETLRIRAPQINLIRQANGQTNWQTLGASTNAQTAGEGASPTPPTWLAGLSLGGITLTDGQISLNDALNNQRLSAEQVDIELSAVALDKASTLRADAIVVAGEQPRPARITAEMTPRSNRSLAIRGATIEWGDLEITQLNADINQTAQGLRVQPLNARFFEGAYQGDVRLATGVANMPLRFNESLTGVAIQPLLSALADLDSLLGTGDVSLTGQMNLAGPAEPLASLNAEGRVSISDGAIQGINIARILRQAAARLQGQQPPATQGPKQTDFTQLDAKLVITDGVARTDDLVLNSPLLRLRGSGQTNLVEQTLDFALSVNVVDSLEGQGASALEQLRGVAIPLQIRGSWRDPSVQIDIAQALKQNQSEQLRERINDEVESLRNQLEGLFE